jgi:hypothetical protein
MWAHVDELALGLEATADILEDEDISRFVE